jgi:hypothetical protein
MSLATGKVHERPGREPGPFAIWSAYGQPACGTSTRVAMT